ncbi:putative NIT2-nitrilase [Acaromyces ingoldii]|uniref:Putative NIT2-nitrilase n=1 Tax=Acaromyces ingoldii TaxID=215250 RepID=A0A316YW38_9BASI|nr:putative NIT2-nitrilase [Acaromyces ingoldii]PWN93246.1 putative NIT2-nitrilase [Acaromyces ingoldii]
MTLAAVAQLTSSGLIAENLSTCISLIRRASSAGAKAIFLPEATDFIAPAASVAALTRSAEARDFVQGIRDAAKSAGIWVSVGIHEDPSGGSSSSSPSSTANGKGQERCYNTQLLVDERGEVRARYRKTHLFDVDIKGGLTILESNTTVPGEELLDPINTPLGNVGLLTCYDLRFAEPALALRARGAHVITYPSAFTVRTGAAHWEVLLRARAIETQSWVLAAAQVGAHAGTARVSWGHAMIVDPYGSVVAQTSDMQPYKPTFCLADIDLDSLENVRREMPLWDQRRTDLYPRIP